MIRSLLHVACALLAATAPAADWPQWRGPDRSGRSPDTGLLKQWPAGGPQRLWLFQDTGLGYAGYSVVGGRLFTMGLRGDQEFVIAVNVADGKEAWAAPVGPKYPNDWGDGPRMTPTVDGDRVYAIGGQGLLICLKTGNGEKVWEKSLTRDLGGRLQNWGYTESPLVVGDRLFCTPGGSRGTMAALNKLTGDVLWRSTELTDDAQYASPILIEHAGRPQLVQLVMRRFFGLDPEDGKLLWQAEFDGRVAVIPTPIYHEGHVYVTAGYGIGSKLVKLGPDHSVSVVYDNKVMKNHHGGVILAGRHLYGYSDGPGWICQDFFTGEEVWADKSLGKGAAHFADGMLYCLDERSGEVALVEATPRGWSEKGRFKLEPLSDKRAPRGGIWPHPVVIGGRLYLRDQENLFCFDVKGS